MASFHGSSVTLVDTFTDNGSSLMESPYTGAFATINGTTFLYVPSDEENGISIFSVAADGSLTYLDSVADTAGTTLGLAADIVTFEVNGNPFLAVTGLSDDGITVFALSDTPGYLTFTDAVFDSEDAAYELNGAWRIQAYETGSSTFLYVAGSSDSGVSVFEVSAAGAISSVQNLPDDADLQLGRPHLSNVFEGQFNVDYIVAGDENQGGFTLFSLNSATGQLSDVASYVDPVEISGGYLPAATTIGGVKYIYLPNDNYDSISVFAHTSGDPVLVQRFRSPVALDRVAEGVLVEIGDSLIYAVGAFSADQMHIYTVDSNPGSSTAGQLVHVQTLENNVNGNPLDFPRVSDSVTIDGRSFLAVTALHGDTVAIYEFGGGDDVLTGTQDDDSFVGGGGDDIIHALGGDDEIDGGADTDLIYAGSGIDTVTASEGTDRSYGGSNFDTFDATSFNGAGSGVQLDTAFNLFRLPDGTKQFIADFERLLGTEQDDDIRGDEANNDLRGFGGDDVLNGRGGNDSLRGHGGDDRLLGVDGNDFLFGGTGNDDLRGGRGNDTINGEDGDDFILGENGSDTINGGRGADAIRGGGGADTFVFDNYVLGATEFDIVRDFTDGSDLLDLSDFGFANAGAALAGASQKAWGVRLQLDADQVVSLEGVSLGNLNGADLIL